MNPSIPTQLRHGIARCRTLLATNDAEIEACVADMKKSEEVDLTDELERLTTIGDALRKKLGTYEDAAARAVDQSSEAQADQAMLRAVQLGDRARHAAATRTQTAVEMTECIRRFVQLKAAYDDANEDCHTSLWQSANAVLSTEEVQRRNLDGRCGAPAFDAIAETIRLSTHGQSTVEACEWVSHRVASVIAHFLATEEAAA
ncbi:MAG: hypothetical protein V4645_11530 [Pseudomonadota bacterium]